MGHFKDTLKGLTWIGALRGITRLLAILRISILARILTPFQFGLFGIATFVLSLLEVNTETGVNILLIQGKEKIEKYLSAAYYVSIVRGFLIGFLVLLSSFLVSRFFNSPDSLSLLLLMSLVPVIRGFINPAVVKLQKELLFHQEFAFQMSSFLVGTTVTVFLAFLTQRAESFVFGLLAESVFKVIASQLFIRPKPIFAFDRAYLKKLFKKGKWVTASSIFSYLFREGDDMVVGKLLGEAALGIYQVAYKISTLPVSEISDVFGKVTFPVYAKIAHDKDRLKRAFFRSTLSVFLLVLPAGMVIFFLARPLVMIFLGEPWVEAIPIVRVLAIFGILRGLLGTTFPLFFALEKQNYVAAVTLLGILGLGVSIIPFIFFFGVVGVGYATIVGVLLSTPLALYFLKDIFYA